jgi:hypothetical protein
MLFFCFAFFEEGSKIDIVFTIHDGLYFFPCMCGRSLYIYMKYYLVHSIFVPQHTCILGPVVPWHKRIIHWQERSLILPLSRVGMNCTAIKLFLSNHFLWISTFVESCFLYNSLHMSISTNDLKKGRVKAYDASFIYIYMRLIFRVYIIIFALLRI